MSSPWNDRLRSSLSASTTTSSAPKRRRRRNKKEAEGPSLADHVKVWVEKKVASGDPEKECSLPFLTNDPKMLNCRLCAKSICLGEEMQCSVLHCEENFHQTCAKEVVGSSVAKPFKCPQHTCYNCKKKGCWRCVRCTIAAHTKCTPWPDGITFTNRPGQAVCWRHPSNWLLDKEEGFHRLPLPYIEEDFQIDSILNDVRENQTEPAPYVPIRRNVYLIKKIRDSVDAGVGCDCSTKSMCKGNCECRSLSVCCSKTCRCLDRCTNKAFRKEKKIEVVKTEYCGWGAVASEALEKGDFVIEYVGEVIDDATCTQRLQDMKHRGDQNIYMCKLNKDFIIDSTYKGNASRFFNHGCNPNCKLEKCMLPLFVVVLGELMARHVLAFLLLVP
ncbi:histone-lysine N-methyltransferase ASHR3-like [Typha latifolia]|uniref:histone-lysine N-methyltransferase ASHR3-like n=1 Tax=Typha latifolia TaxID=4733 RepID=UPI003C2E41D2